MADHRPSTVPDPAPAPRRPRRRAMALAALVLLAGCSRLGLPGVALPGSGGDDARRLVVDRVWVDTDPDAPRGTLLAFLSNGTLVMTSCGETYRLAPWRWVEGSTLVWDEDGAFLRAEVAGAERRTMVLLVEVGDETVTRTFRAAEPPEVCPDLRG